jgi:hypothetical protein
MLAPAQTGPISGLSRLIEQLTPAPLLYLQTAAGVEAPAGRRGRRYWVVSRGLCRFFAVPLLPEAAAARQRDALQLQIRRLSPFAETGSHCHFGEKFVSLWLWDQAAVREAAGAIGIDAARVKVLPEPALRPPAADGVRLVATLDGVEAQSWSEGAVAASRWWAAAPDARAWTLYQRGASLPPERLTASPPPPLSLPWLARPWTHDRQSATVDLGRIDMRLVAAGVAVLLFAGYGYLGAEWVHLENQLAQSRAQVAARSRAIDPILAARATALDNQAAIGRIRGFDRFPDQLTIMARVAGILPQNDAHFTDWDYEAGKLDLTIAADQPLDALYFVQSLERVHGFSGVGAERAGGDNSLRLRLTVDPQ